MNRIDQMTGNGEKFFVAYYTAGFPTVEASGAILDTLVESGCDLIELGYPFSDPTADGPTIQSSSQAALENGFTRAAYFQLLEEFRERHPDVPAVVFSYYNPIFHYGIEKFAESAKTAGADGILIVDLPHEEQADVRAVLDSQGLHLIQLIAPTTGQERPDIFDAIAAESAPRLSDARDFDDHAVTNHACIFYGFHKTSQVLVNILVKWNNSSG